MNLGLVHLSIVALAFVQYSRPYIWQNAGVKEIFLRHYYHRYMKIPPRLVTAHKFARYFLDRGDNIYHHSRGRVRRSNVRLDFKPDYYYDIAFLLDSSTSVGRRNFHVALRALNHITKRGMRNTRYAAITYSKSAKIEFNFTGSREAKVKLHNIRYRPGNTNTQDALRMALHQLFDNPASNVRNGSLRRVLLVTDGLSNVHNHLTLLRAFELKASGVEVFIVAVGRYIYGMDEIIGMASSTYAHLFRVHHMRGLAQVIKLIPVVPLPPDKTWLSSMHASRYVYKQTVKKKRT